MNTQYNTRLLLTLLLPVVVLSLVGCISKHKTKQAAYNNQAVIIAEDKNNQPAELIQNQTMSDAGIDQAVMAETSGISPPVEEDVAIEPAAEENVALETAVEESPMLAAPAEESPMSETPAEESPVSEAPVKENTMMEAPTSNTMQHSGKVIFTNLSEIPANYYAVQVVATSSMQNLNAFAQQHSLSTNLTAQTIVNGKTWNILLLGAYPTLAEAKAAASKIRGSINTSPWIRQIRTLQ